MVTRINYPEHIGLRYDQQLPLASIPRNISVQNVDRQNTTFEQPTFNGDNKVFMPPTPVPTLPNTNFFQGSSVAPGVHPNNDKAGQATTANTTRPDFRGGQGPTQKLPNGISLASLLPPETPALYDLAPPPDPQVLPGEGTAPLQPTAPAWW